MPTTSQIITVGTVAVVLSIAGYAIYFDYARRNDPQFRKKLRKEKKRVDRSNASIKASNAASAKGKSAPTDAELDAALQVVRSEELPATPELKEQYFMQNLAIGEQLAAQGLALPAALSFFRAMRVYPEPLQLVMILEKTLPEEMFQIVMDLMSRDVKHKVDVYYDYFPPKSMNVKVKIIPVGELNGVKTSLQKTTLVAAKDFKAGDTIYQEIPITAALDADLIGTGQYCSYCLRVTPKGMAIRPPLDPFQSTYCSEKCHSKADEQYQSLLFGSIPPSTPANPNPTRTKAQVEERKAAQEAFVAQIKDSGRTAALLVIRFVGALIADEHRRLKGEESDHKLPEVGKESNLTYSAYDYIERLRSLEIISGPQEEKEIAQSRTILKVAIEGLEEFLNDEKYLQLKGKIAYNGFGVYYHAGRDERPQPNGSPDTWERTRAAHGTTRQIGTAFYRVSSYLNHSCAPNTKPTFANGTSELHLIAERDIKEGEELTITYVDVHRKTKDKNLLEARKRRRMELARGWGFACDCSRCKEEAATIQNSADSEADSSLPLHGVKLDPAVERYLASE